MEVTEAKEYLAQQRKMVTLPSGFVFEIRKMPPMVYARMKDLIGVGPNDSPEGIEEKVEKGQQEMMELVVPRCVVRTKIVLENPAEDELSLDDLEIEDFLALLEEISEFSGISEEGIQERESFREE